MAQTQISDVVVPEVFAPYVQVLSTELSLLVRSGVIATSPALDSFLAGGGKFIDMPFWNDLGDTEANVSGDDRSDLLNPVVTTSGNDAVAQKITTGQTDAIRCSRNQNWSSMDLASQLVGSDPMQAIAQRVAEYWVRQDQLQLNAILKGLVAGTSTLVNDIAEGAQGTPAASNKFSAEALLDTFQLMGDHKQNIRAIAVHSVIHTAMQKANLIDFVADSEANVGFGTFMGKTLIVDDGVAVTSDGTNDEYFTVCFGEGAFQYGRGSARVPAEVSRLALAGNGGGQEVLSSRREFVLHPAGFSVASDVAAGQSPTNTELAASTAYSLQVDRKLIPMSILKSNG
jgi:hypothetical protein